MSDLRVIDDACCTLAPGHDGLCVWFCSTCLGTGDCPDCNGAGPELCGCSTCDTTGTCPECLGAGYFTDDGPVPRPIETITPVGGLL